MTGVVHPLGAMRGVNIRDMGDNWTYSRVFSQQQQNPNIVPWDAFHGGGPSPMRMPRYNPQTNKFQQVVYNPWGRGIGQQTMLGVSANILSLDGGTMEEEIYLIPEAGLPKDQAASWVPCQAGANPLIFDELTHPQAGFVVLRKHSRVCQLSPISRIFTPLSSPQRMDHPRSPYLNKLLKPSHTL